MTSVVVSGLGVMAPAGRDLPSFWDSVSTGRTFFHETPTMPGSGIIVAAIGPEVGFDDLPLASTAPCDRSALLAVAAARSALVDAGLTAPFDNPARVAIVIGNGGGGLTTLDEQYRRLFRDGMARAHPFSVIRIMGSSSASWLSLAFGAKGPCFVTSSACASATQAIGTAAQLIRAGLADVAITGGTEAPLSEGTLRGWAAMKVMSRSTCRPFSRGREGLIVSEGAGILILESAAHARARGHRPRTVLAGFASNADAGDIVAPTAEGMARAMRDALRDADLDPARVDYVNAHGTGTQANDGTETTAMKLVFGEGRTPPVSSSKGVLGHALGAAGALEAVATIMAMNASLAPPTANYLEPAPECDIDVIPNVARPMPIAVAMSNSFAFGGLNASLIFRGTGADGGLAALRSGP